MKRSPFPLLPLLLGAASSAVGLQAGAGALVGRLLDVSLTRVLSVPYRKGETRFNLLRPSVKVAPLVLLQGEGKEEFLRVDSARAFLRIGWLSARLAGLTVNRPEIRIRPGTPIPFRVRRPPEPLEEAGVFRLAVRDGRVLWEGGPLGALRLEDVQLDLVSAEEGGLAGDGTARWTGGMLSTALRLGRGEVCLEGIVRLEGEVPGPAQPFDPRGPVAVSLRIEEGGALRASAAPKGLSIRIPETGLRVEAIAGSVGVEAQDVRFDLAGTCRGGTVTARGSARPGGDGTLEADFEASGFAVDGTLRPLASLDRTALEVLEGLALEGRVDLRGRVLRRAGAWDGALETRIRDLRARCEGFRDRESGRVYGFAYPVRLTRGTASARPDRVWLHDFSGSMGSASFSLAGEISGGARPGLELDLRAAGLPFDAEVRTALEKLEGGTKTFDEFAPRGPADVRLRLSHPPGESRLRYEATIEPRGASASWRPLPLRVHDLSGGITFEEDRVFFDLSGPAASGRVAVHGEVSGPRAAADPSPGLLLRVSGEGLEIGSELLLAATTFAPTILPWLEALEPLGGRLALEASVFRPRGARPEEVAVEARLDVDGVSIRIPGLGIRAGGVSGSIFVGASRGRKTVQADTLRGDLLGSTVFGSLAHRETDSGEEFALEVDAPRVPLDPRVQEAFADALGLPWLRPDAVDAAGAFDLHLAWRRGPGGSSPSARLRLRDVSLRGRKVPFAVEGIEGRLLVDADGIRGDEEGLAFRIAGARARIRPLALRVEEGRPIGSFLLRATDLPLPSSFERALPPDLARPLRELRISGTADLEDVRIELRPSAGHGIAFEAAGDVALRGASFDPGISISELDARLRLDRLALGPGGASAAATIAAARGRLLGLPVEDLRASLDAQPDRLTFTGLSATLAGGDLRARQGREPLVVHLGDPPSFSTSLSLRGADLRRLLAEIFPRAGDLRGRLDARFDLEGTPGDLGSFRGKGTIDIERGALGEIPVFGEIFALLHAFEIGHAPEFQEGKAHFEIAKRKVRFGKIELKSDVLEIVGLENRGEMGFDGDLDLLFESRVFPEIPIVRPLYDLLREVLPRIWRIHVRGSLASPKVTLETSNPELNQIFGLGESTRRLTWLPRVPDPLERKSPLLF
ncbi:MAG TPA: hypothetical protein VFI25_05615 [Planctomycetota bacterium]|nr:hypothetical protein [Planctomycetota bacterium]